MDLSPIDYDSWAQVIKKYSEHLIDNIKKQNESYTNVVDIGSGLGNVSQLLIERLNIKNFVGIDVDPKMVEFANKNKKSTTKSTMLNFILQDIAVDWDLVKPEVKALEGKVDLIFSSFVIHFIRNKRKAAENISKLLAPGGQLQAVTFCLTDSLGTQTNGNGVPMKIPPAKDQVEQWTSAFESAGLKVEQAKLFKFEEAVPYNVAKVFYQAIYVSYKLFLTEQLDEKTAERVITLAKDKLLENSHKFIGDMNGTEMVRCESDIYTLKVTKIK